MNERQAELLSNNFIDSLKGRDYHARISRFSCLPHLKMTGSPVTPLATLLTTLWLSLNLPTKKEPNTMRFPSIKSARKLLFLTVVALFLIAGAISVYASELTVLATAPDGSHCTRSCGSSAGPYVVCYAVSTGEYTFFNILPGECGTR